MGNFYIYLHSTSDTGIPFYIGKGKNRRAYTRHGRSSHWNNIVNKHGFIVDIISTGLSEDEAFNHEKRFISFYGKIKNNSGPLINITDGGDGVSGCNEGNKNWMFRVETDETRRKKSESHKGKKRPDHSRKMMGNSWHRSRGIGYHQSEETKQKLRLANLGKKQSEETRKKMSEAQYRRWAKVKAL